MEQKNRILRLDDGWQVLREKLVIALNMVARIGVILRLEIEF